MPANHRGGPVSIPGHLLWGFVVKNWYRHRFFSQIHISISFPQFGDGRTYFVFFKKGGAVYDFGSFLLMFSGTIVTSLNFYMWA